MQLRAKNSHESRINTPVDPPPGSPSEGVSSQSVGENQDALTLLRSAAAAAVMAGDWKLVDRIRAVLAPSEPAVDHSNVRRLDALRGKHR